MIPISEKIQTIKKRLFHYGENNSLSIFSIVILIFLDIFVLSALFQGLGDQTKQLVSPEDYIPYEIRNIVLDEDWGPTQRLDNLQHIVRKFDYTYTRRHKHMYSDVHPLCQNIYTKIETIKKDQPLVDSFNERWKLQRKEKSVKKLLRNLNVDLETYDHLQTFNKTQALPGDLKESANVHLKNLSNIRQELTNLNSELNLHPSIQLLWAYIDESSPSVSSTLKEDLRKLSFWFPVKEFAFQLIFLLPIFLVFYFWNSRSIRRASQLQILISTHLLVVTSIPIFIKLVDACLHIIPTTLIKDFIALLEKLHIIAIWHYVVIALSILIGLAAIVFVQKKIFNKERLIQTRFKKCCCLNCGQKLQNPQQAFCSYCGYHQQIPCTACKKPVSKAALFCDACGQKNS